jgi:hypothetical protein
MKAVTSVTESVRAGEFRNAEYLPTTLVIVVAGGRM